PRTRAALGGQRNAVPARHRPIAPFGAVLVEELAVEAHAERDLARARGTDERAGQRREAQRARAREVEAHARLRARKELEPAAREALALHPAADGRARVRQATGERARLPPLDPPHEEGAGHEPEAHSHAAP